MSVQIFLSYARIDDELPPNMRDGKGFVTCLFEQLCYEFEQLGAPWPEIWRDIRSIEPADQFDPIIADAIEESDLFIVVLSPNWMQSDYCKYELEAFRRRWESEGELRVRQRIVVACKRFVDRGKRPSLLQGQQGYDFFIFEGPRETGQQFDFFARGEIRDKRYDATVGGLARLLSRRAQQITRPPALAAAIAPDPPPPIPSPPKLPRPAAGARKIYLAKPASDMREAYSRLVEELSRNGYAIAPDPEVDIPHDASAASFIDQAMGDAYLSIHLLGENDGYTPERLNQSDASEPIVKLQLNRAAAKVSGGNGQHNESYSGFRRIIWAPELMEDGADPALSEPEALPPQSSAPTSARRRQPEEVLAKFAKFLPSDKVLGISLSKFVDFLAEHLKEPNPAVEIDGPTLTGDNWVYVYHEAADLKYAKDLAKALRQRGIVANLPALQGDPGEVGRLHKKFLAECSAVVLCWAQATEVWARTRANELNWRKLGRSEKFTYRGLLACPPPGDSKATFVELPPLNEIDVTVDTTSGQPPLAEAIEPFVQLARPHVQ